MFAPAAVLGIGYPQYRDVSVVEETVSRYDWATIVSASVVCTASVAGSVVAGKRCRAGDRTMYSTIAAVGAVTAVAMLA